MVLDDSLYFRIAPLFLLNTGKYANFASRFLEILIEEVSFYNGGLHFYYYFKIYIHENRRLISAKYLTLLLLGCCCAQLSSKTVTKIIAVLARV